MGMYDTVMVPCPTCGERAEFQSKSGRCMLETYTLEEAPDEVLFDVNRHGPNTCTKCKTQFSVAVKLAARSVRTVVSPESTVLVLDRYERDNLIALLRLIYGQEGGPTCLATGDWAGQIYWKLAERGFDPAIHKPNQSPEAMLEALLQWSKGQP